MGRNGSQQIRLQPHRAGSHALGTTDTRLYLAALGFLLVHNQNTGASFGCRYIRIYQSFTHHRATADNLARIFGQTAASFNQLLHRRTDTCQEIGRLCQRLTSHGNDTLKQRFVLLYGLVNGKCGTHILHHSSRGDRQRTGCNLATDDSINQLLFTTLRILYLQGYHLDTCIAGSNLRHQLDGIGLIVLNADECLVHLYRLHQNGYTYHNFFRMFQHQLMVGSQIRFALYGVDDDTLCLECRRRTQLDLRREACTAQTYDTCISDFLHDFLGGQTAFLHQRFGTVNGFFPFIPFYVNEYSRLGVTAGIDNRVNLSDFPADRRMNGC